MPARKASLAAVPPEPIEDEQRPLLDSEHPDHGTITEQQAEEEARAVAAEENPDRKGPSSLKIISIMFPLWCLTFVAAADSTIVATLASPIASSFKSFTLVTWVASGYLVAASAFQPLSGRVTDIYGRGPGLLFASIFFAIGTLMCGLAQSPGVIIAGRLIAGAGGGCTNTLSVFIATDLIPLRRRGLWQGFGNLLYGAGMASGGVLGGVISDRLGWRWAFHMQVPLIVIAGAVAYFRTNIPVKESDKSKIKRVDFAGAVTLVISLSLLLLGLNMGGNIKPWTHPLVITSLILAILFLLAFIYIEARIASEPIIPVRLCLHRTVMAALLTNWFFTMNVFALWYYVPIYFTALQHLSSTAAGVRLIPATVGTALGSMTAGALMRITGRYRILNAVGVFLFVVASALVAIFFRPGLAMWPPFPILALHGFCYGSTLTVSLLALLAAVSHSHQAVITSASYAFRSTGSSIGITLAGAVFQNILSQSLNSRFGDSPDAAKIISRLRDDPGEIAGLGPRWRKGVEEAYADALRGVWGLILGLGVLAAAASLCMKEHRLHSTIDRK